MTEISKEYGTALFMLACEKDKKHEYADAISVVKGVFADTPEYIDFLASRGISLRERLSAIEEAFANNIPEDVVSYLQLLCEKGRISGFFESAEEYEKLLDASEKISNAKVTSALELTEEEKTALKSKLEKICKTTVTIEYLIDESLIGGIIVETDGKVLDGSLRNRLREIKEVINT